MVSPYVMTFQSTRSMQQILFVLQKNIKFSFRRVLSVENVNKESKLAEKHLN